MLPDSWLFSVLYSLLSINFEFLYSCRATRSTFSFHSFVWDNFHSYSPTEVFTKDSSHWTNQRLRNWYDGSDLVPRNGTYWSILKYEQRGFGLLVFPRSYILLYRYGNVQCSLQLSFNCHLTWMISLCLWFIWFVGLLYLDRCNHIHHTIDQIL